MGTGILEVRARVREMIATGRAILVPVAAQLRSVEGEDSPQARWLLERLAHTLNAHIDELTEHLGRLGGGAPQTNAGEQLARSLRNSYTALSLAHAAELMLETDARAYGYSSTAAMATRHREEIATLLAGIRELLPAAVKEEIDNVEVGT